MTTGAVTLSREDFDKIRNAIRTAIDSIVAIQELCALGHDAMGSGLAFALESVNKRQEDAVCEADELIREKYLQQGAAA